MKNILRISICLTVSLVLLGVPAALAAELNQDKIETQSMRGGIRELSRNQTAADVAVPLPMPIQEPVDPLSSTRGPVAFSPDARPSIGSAIVAPRGGMMASPKEQADREIERVIKKLQ